MNNFIVYICYFKILSLSGKSIIHEFNEVETLEEETIEKGVTVEGISSNQILSIQNLSSVPTNEPQQVITNITNPVLEEINNDIPVEVKEEHQISRYILLFFPY